MNIVRSSAEFDAATSVTDADKKQDFICYLPDLGNIKNLMFVGIVPCYTSMPRGPKLANNWIVCSKNS